MEIYSEEYYRNLPHIQPPDGAFFITYRLKGSLPKHIIESYREEFLILKANKKTHKEAINLFIDIADNYLDNYSDLHHLRNPQIAKIVADSLHYFDGKYYKLMAYCIMSNHVHVVVDQNGYDDVQLSDIFGRIKSYSANECNKVLNKNGAFWTPEIYDHLLLNRNEIEHYIKYTLNNPVVANLTDKWSNWPHSYVYKDWIDDDLKY